MAKPITRHCWGVTRSSGRPGTPRRVITMKRLVLVVVLAAAWLCLLAAPALASPKTFYVHPSGGNDTANIQAAFNAAVKAGPGSTVQLSAGHFYTNTIFVQNFNGTFRGAGQGKTCIDVVSGTPPWARSRSTTPATRSRPGHRCTASWAAACVSSV